MVGFGLQSMLGDDGAFTIEKVECQRRTARLCGERSVNMDEGLAVAMLKRLQLIQQPAGEGGDTLMNSAVTDACQMIQPESHGWNVKEIQGAVLKAGGCIGRIVFSASNGGYRRGAAGKPAAVELFDLFATRKQNAATGGVAKHFVKGNWNEIGFPQAEIQLVGGHKGSRIQQHIPAQLLGAGDPGQVVLDAGEVGLGGVGEQVGALPIDLLQSHCELFFVQAQVRQYDGDISDLSAFGKRILADTVDRVVVVEGEQVAAACPERVALANQLERCAGIVGEDAGVFLRVGIEELEDLNTGFLHQAGGLRGGGVVGVRVAKDGFFEKAVVRLELGAGVETRAGVIQVDMPVADELRVFLLSQVIDEGGGCVLRVTLDKLGVAGVGHGDI